MTKQVGRNEAIYKNILPGAGALHRPYLDDGFKDGEQCRADQEKRGSPLGI